MVLYEIMHQGEGVGQFITAQALFKYVNIWYTVKKQFKLIIIIIWERSIFKMILGLFEN